MLINIRHGSRPLRNQQTTNSNQVAKSTHSPSPTLISAPSWSLIGNWPRSRSPRNLKRKNRWLFNGTGLVQLRLIWLLKTCKTNSIWMTAKFNRLKLGQRILTTIPLCHSRVVAYSITVVPRQGTTCLMLIVPIPTTRRWLFRRKLLAEVYTVAVSPGSWPSSDPLNRARLQAWHITGNLTSSATKGIYDPKLGIISSRRAWQPRWPKWTSKNQLSRIGLKIIMLKI